MAIIIQLATGQRVTVERDIATIGQDWSCDVVLAQAPGIQSIHATIMKIGDKWMIESPGDWPLKIGSGPAGRSQWLKRGNVIHLTPSGPDIIFDLPVVKPPPEPAAAPGKPSKTPQRVAPGAAPPRPEPATAKGKLVDKATDPFRRILTDLAEIGRSVFMLLTFRSRRKQLRLQSYEALGRHVYESGVYRLGLPTEHQKLDHLLARLVAHRPRRPQRRPGPRGCRLAKDQATNRPGNGRSRQDFVGPLPSGPPPARFSQADSRHGGPTRRNWPLASRPCSMSVNQGTLLITFRLPGVL